MKAAYGPKVKTFEVPTRLRTAFGEHVQANDLKPIAKQLWAFLRVDLQKIQDKHLTGTSGEMLLRACPARRGIIFRPRAACSFAAVA